MLTATRGSYVLVVQQDDSPFNPREDDNFGKMVCFHRQYSLGDHHNYIDKDDFLRDLYLKTVGDDERGAHRYERALDLMNYKIKAPFGSPDYERQVDERLMKVISQKYLMLPLYLYDHSGITMNTTGFSCPWDSGQVGWIYASKEDALREFGGSMPPKKMPSGSLAANPLLPPPGRKPKIVCAERWNVTIPTFAARLTVLNCIKTASWRIAAGALSAVTRKP